MVLESEIAPHSACIFNRQYLIQGLDIYNGHPLAEWYSFHIVTLWQTRPNHYPVYTMSIFMAPIPFSNS